MRIVLLLLSGLLFVGGAQAQSFNPYMYYPGGGLLTGTPLPTDLVSVSRNIPFGQQGCGVAPEGCFINGLLPINSFASAADIQNLNSSTNARIDQAYQQINNNYNQLVQQINNSNIQLSRGVAAATALSGPFMPSAPGRVSWAVNGSTFNGEFGGGLSVAYRLNTSVPVAVTAAYGNGGGTANVGRVGLMGEF